MKTIKYLFTLHIKITSWLFFKVLFSPKYYFQKNATRNIKAPAIIVSNHRGIFDPPILFLTFFKKHINMIAAETLFKNKLLAAFFKSIGCIKIDRNKLDTENLYLSINKLKNKEIICLFPEGKINKSNKLLPFMSSYIIMAIKTNSPIIPVYIANSYKVFRRQKIVIGEPIFLNKYHNNEELNLKLIDHLNEIVFSKMIELQKSLF